MTTKQFNWLKNNRHLIEISWFDVYKGKEPKNFHHLYGGKRLNMSIIGERFYFAGTYHTFNGRDLVEHYVKFDVHYKNMRVIRYYRRTY